MRKFNFKSLDEILVAAQNIGIDLPYNTDISPLFESAKYGHCTLDNRFVIQPMEGCDGTIDGSPDELTIRRYKRFAGSGAGLIWAEACAITKEARANPRQLFLDENNLNDYADLVNMIKREAKDKNGKDFSPVIFLQLTHSGRYSKSEGVSAPIIANHCPLDATSGVTEDTLPATDDYLRSLPEKFAKSAKLALKAGFDGVDIKSCHRYLFSELLAAYARENSVYGGESFENRKRLLIETINAVTEAVKGEMEITSRMNVYDGMEYPYGFGSDYSGKNLLMDEPLKLIGEMISLGYQGINITLGNPYFSPHLNRPYDTPIKGGYIADEDQIRGIYRFIEATRAIKEMYTDLHVVLSGLTWARSYFPFIASGVITKNWANSIGLGRMFFAYPDFIHDLRENGKLDDKKVCIACSLCSQIMRNSGKAGCAMRDREIYKV